jgi:hypothetical protein
MIKNLQKVGGIAALGHTTALMVGMVLSFTLMFPLLDATPDQAQIFLSGNPSLVQLWNWVVDWGSAITLVVMLLALYERLKPGTPALMQAAVVFGFLWAGLTIGARRLNLHNFGVDGVGAQSMGFTVQPGSCTNRRSYQGAWLRGRVSRHRGKSHNDSRFGRGDVYDFRAGYDDMVCMGGNCHASPQHLTWTNRPETKNDRMSDIK